MWRLRGGMKIGVGYREPLADWIATRPVSCLEITAEHFYERGERRLQELARDFTLFVHGLGLSLGTPGKLDAERLRKFARVAELANAAWVSEHVSFTRTAEVDLGHLTPVKPTKEAARIIADHAKEVADVCQRPIILENITSHLRLAGELSETDFLNAVCEQSGCGLLVDVTNLFINSRNHDFDPVAWIHELRPEAIRQMHIVGYSMEHGRYADGHAEPVQAELIDLAKEVAAHASVEAMILERDTEFPEATAMNSEIAKLRVLEHAD